MPFVRSRGEPPQTRAGEDVGELRSGRRFEYHVLRVATKVRAEGQLNDLGRKGWQLAQVVAMDGYLAFYLEREIAADDAASAP